MKPALFKEAGESLALLSGNAKWLETRENTKVGTNFTAKENRGGRRTMKHKLGWYVPSP